MFCKFAWFIRSVYSLLDMSGEYLSLAVRLLHSGNGIAVSQYGMVAFSRSSCSSELVYTDVADLYAWPGVKRPLLNV